MTGERRRRRRLAAAGLALLGFAFLGSRGLLEPDEGRYANVAAHMLRSGDFLVPALNAETPHFAKPPLTYWAIAASTRVLGHDPWAARLPNALAWIATVLLVGAAARRLGEPAPSLAAGVYATFLLPYLGAAMLTTDTLLAAFETLAAVGLVGLWRTPSGSVPSASARLAAGAGLGLAFLTKGPVGLLPLLCMAVTLVLLGEARAMRRWLHPVVLGPFLLFGGGWFGWLALSRPAVLETLVREELYGRVVEGRFDRHPEWYGALLVYGPSLLLGMLPWSPLVLSRPRELLASLRRRFASAGRQHDPAGLFLLVWLLLPLAILALVRSRLPLYLVPTFAPAALLVARRIERTSVGREPARTLLASWLVVLVGARAVAAWLPLAADPGALARQLAEQVVPPPRRIVFVDDTPRWGLGYTLDVEIAGATLLDPEDPYPPVAELAREPGEGHLYLVRRFAKHDFRDVATAAGQSVRERGSWDHQVFLEIVPGP